MTRRPRPRRDASADAGVGHGDCCGGRIAVCRSADRAARGGSPNGCAAEADQLSGVRTRRVGDGRVTRSG